MRAHVTADDKGKEVVHEDDTVGRVIDVDGDTAYVDPDTGIAETLAAKLGLAVRDGDAFALESNAIEAVTDDEVRVGLPDES